MKKVIAISVVFALLATAAFAIEITGQVIGAATLAEGDIDPESDINAGASVERIRLTAEAQNEAGTFGAWAQLDYKGPALILGEGLFDIEIGPGGGPDPSDFYGFLGSGLLFSGYAWWQPIEQFRLIIGGDGGGCSFFPKDGVTGWLFHGDAGDTGVAVEEWAFFGKRAWGETGPFFGGFGENAIMMEIRPIELLGINIIVPFNFVNSLEYGGHGGNFYRGTIAQLDLNFGDHNVALTYEGDYSEVTDGRIYLYYGFGQEDGMLLDVGIAYELENEDHKGAALPFTFGLGFSNAFTDTVGFKARLMGTFHTQEVGDDTYNNPAFRLDLLPSFVINDLITAYIGLGIGIQLYDDKLDTDAEFNWLFNPYIVVGGHFFAGIQVWSAGTFTDKDGKEQDNIKWAIPIGINFSF